MDIKGIEVKSLKEGKIQVAKNYKQEYMVVSTDSLDNLIQAVNTNLNLGDGWACLDGPIHTPPTASRNFTQWHQAMVRVVEK